MRENELTASQEECLRDQVISLDQPGTLLRDFNMLLEYIGPKGVEAAGKHNLLPIKLIGELDRRLSRPLHLELKRPQLRSHPYLQGLNLLLRASGLTRIEAAGTKARLVVNPEMMVQWEQLNPTEQYFNLLEAWLRFGRSEMVGERGGFEDGFLYKCLQAWQSLPENGCRFDLKKPLEIRVSGIYRNFYLLALMDLFGLVEVIRPTQPITPWGPAAIKHVPFGDAIFTLLKSVLESQWQQEDFVELGHEEQEDEDEDEDEDDFEDEDEDAEEDEDEDEGEAEELEDQEDWALEQPQFGAWQPVFQPYFPLWQENLRLPELKPRQGTFIFRVSLGKIWRLIAIPADATLDNLVDVILDSVNFDNDHLHAFTYRNALGGEVTINHYAMDEPPYTDRVKIGRLPLEPGATMDLTYDFGDNWKFTVKLERIDPPDPKLRAPRILERHGKAPQQYGNWDD